LELFVEALTKAIHLLLSFDYETYLVIWFTLKVSITAILISTILSIPLALYISTNQFRFKHFILSTINTGMAMPPVLAGLFITIFLWRNGFLGRFNLLYTPQAIIIAQIFLATPIILGISISALQSFPKKFMLQILGLGATKFQLYMIMIRECKLTLLSAIMAGFGAIISEVGASMMVGGNIKGYTRVLTTAIVTETGKGNFELAMAYGIILLLLSFSVNMILTKIQQKNRTEHE
jgi:tungstate transport system permease protein